jgi:hypothetical protein
MNKVFLFTMITTRRTWPIENMIVVARGQRIILAADLTRFTVLKLVYSIKR